MSNEKCALSSCFANTGGSCIALRDTSFKGKTCPFYKTRDADKKIADLEWEREKLKLENRALRDELGRARATIDGLMIAYEKAVSGIL